MPRDRSYIMNKIDYHREQLFRWEDQLRMNTASMQDTGEARHEYDNYVRYNRNYYKKFGAYFNRRSNGY